MRERSRRPGSQGEHVVQDRCGTWERAQAFYDHQWLDYLNPQMRAFIGRQEMVFIATADSQGDCDASFRAGLPGFVHVLDEKTLTYPEYRGNGVKASLGNITENPHIGLLFIDFFEAKIGLHVNGRAQILSSEELLQRPSSPRGCGRTSRLRVGVGQNNGCWSPSKRPISTAPSTSRCCINASRRWSGALIQYASREATTLRPRTPHVVGRSNQEDRCVVFQTAILMFALDQSLRRDA